MSDTPTDGFPCPLCEGKGVRLRAKMGATAQRVTGTVLAPEQCPFCHGEGRLPRPTP